MGLSSSTAATLSTAGQGFGGGMSAVGAYYSAQGQKAALGGQAKIADINAHMDELTAQSALLTGQRAEQNSMLQTTKLKSTQRTAQLANGISANSDTFNQVLTTTDVMGEIDANTINANAARSAWGYRMAATNEQSKAAGLRLQADGINPFGSALGTLVTSATSVAKNYYKLNKEGAFQDTTTKPGTVTASSPGYFERSFPETYRSIF